MPGTPKVSHPLVDDHLFQAPGNGLVLRQVHYDQYNKDYGEKGKGSLEWEDSQDLMNHFAKENILPQIFELDVGQ